MTRVCAVCADRPGAERYSFGAVHGHVCPACAATLRVALTDWMQQRMRELATLRRRQARDEQRAQLELEAMPVVTRRPVSGRA